MGAAAVIISGGLRLNLFPAILRATVEILIKHERSLAQEAVAIFARMRSTFGDRASHEALMATLNSMSTDRKSVVSGKSVSVSVDLGGRRIIKKKNKNRIHTTSHLDTQTI